MHDLRFIAQRTRVGDVSCGGAHSSAIAARKHNNIVVVQRGGRGASSSCGRGTVTRGHCRAVCSRRARGPATVAARRSRSAPGRARRRPRAGARCRGAPTASSAGPPVLPPCTATASVSHRPVPRPTLCTTAMIRTRSMHYSILL